MTNYDERVLQEYYEAHVESEPIPEDDTNGKWDGEL